MQSNETEQTEVMNSENGAPAGVSLALVNGLKAGSNLRPNQTVQLTLTGVEFGGVLTRERWLEGLRMLKMADTSSTLWLADFIEVGRERFGEEAVSEALVQMEFNALSAQHAMAVLTLPRGIRHPFLTSEHYYVISKADLDTAGQTRWAALAVENTLSPSRLSQCIEAGKLLPASSGGGRNGRGGLVTVEGMGQLFKTWFARVQEEDPVDKWDDDRKRRALSELREPAELAMRLARELGEQIGGAM